MASTTLVDFDRADETREFPHERWDIVHLGSTTVARGTMEPGWHWAEHVKPLVGTDSCQQRHVGYLVSGRLRVVMEDGTETVCEPGQVYVIEPGHDAWSVGEEPVVGLEFSEQSAATYAQDLSVWDSREQAETATVGREAVQQQLQGVLAEPPTTMIYEVYEPRR